MVNLKIENKKPIQEDFWGNGAVYHGFAGMPDDANRVYTEEQCEIEAKRAADMRLKIARTRYQWWAWDDVKKEWNWDNEIMQAFYRWLKRMKDGNITVALNSGWCSPGDINSTSWGGKSPFTVEGDWEKSKQNYADWVSETIHQLVEVRGFTNVKILTLFTEPQNGAGVIPDGFDTYTIWLDASKAVHDTLVRDGRRNLVYLMGPNEGSTVTSVMLKWVAEHSDFLDLYSSHTYQFNVQIEPQYIKTGSTAVSTGLPGARFSKYVKFKKNTDYEFSADLLYKTTAEEFKGDVVFGLFEMMETDDIFRGTTNIPGIVENSIISVKPEELSDEYKTFSFKFNSGDNEEGRVGLFHDFKNSGTLYTDCLVLKEVGKDENIIENGYFENGFEGWSSLFAASTFDAYSDWYEWANTGIQYVPGPENSKPYCFDEYNVTFDRDNSHPSHGAEICNAAIAIMNTGARCSLLWTVFDQQWPNSHSTNHDSFFDGDHRCGVMPLLTRSLVPHLSYYAFTLISKYVDGEGTKVYKGLGENNVNLTMSYSKDGDITVVVVNCKSSPDEFTVNFDLPINKTLNRHAFSPKTCKPDEKAEILGIDKVFENVQTTFTDKIDAYSVSVYTTHND